MRNRILISIIALFTAVSLSGKPSPELKTGMKIQLAILLDTSSSMDGLINQARSQLWRIVNELSRASRDGISPKLEVALFEYGNSALPEGEGYMRMITSFTGDLDRISAELFKLDTNGGDEYCGMVIDSSLRNLTWDRNENSLKLVFIAGNEPFDQGSTRYTEAVSRARERGIIINTIFCGDAREGMESHWKDGADLGGGKFLFINQNADVIMIEAPQDAELAEMNRELNSTYLAYGNAGSEKKKEQEKQDRNAEGISSESRSERTISKASDRYDSSDWDIVDGVERGAVDLEKINSDDLPSEMKAMDMARKKQYISDMSKKREIIKKKINRLSDERRTYIEKMQKDSVDETLDSAVIRTIREQGEKKKFIFK